MVMLLISLSTDGMVAPLLNCGDQKQFNEIWKTMMGWEGN